MRPDTCIHFNGVMNDCCDKSVNYQKLAGGDLAFGWMLRIPCTGKTVAPVNECQHFQKPTTEQIAQEEADLQDRLARYEKVWPVVAKWRKEAPRGKQTVIDCPTGCGGKLHLMQARSNGHVHGKCDTEGCVSWME